MWTPFVVMIRCVYLLSMFFMVVEFFLILQNLFILQYMIFDATNYGLGNIYGLVTKS